MNSSEISGYVPSEYASESNKEEKDSDTQDSGSSLEEKKEGVRPEEFVRAIEGIALEKAELVSQLLAIDEERRTEVSKGVVAQSLGKYTDEQYAAQIGIVQTLRQTIPSWPNEDARLSSVDMLDRVQEVMIKKRELITSAEEEVALSHPEIPVDSAEFNEAVAATIFSRLNPEGSPVGFTYPTLAARLGHIGSHPLSGTELRIRYAENPLGVTFFTKDSEAGTYLSRAVYSKKVNRGNVNPTERTGNYLYPIVPPEHNGRTETIEPVSGFINVSATSPFDASNTVRISKATLEHEMWHQVGYFVLRGSIQERVNKLSEGSNGSRLDVEISPSTQEELKSEIEATVHDGICYGFNGFKTYDYVKSCLLGFGSLPTYNYEGVVFNPKEWLQDTFKSAFDPEYQGRSSKYGEVVREGVGAFIELQQYYADKTGDEMKGFYAATGMVDALPVQDWPTMSKMAKRYTDKNS